MAPENLTSEADPWPAQQIRARAAGLLMLRIRVQLSPFLAGMERRMARDLERLHAYYSDLRTEAAALRDKRKRNGASEEALKADQMRPPLERGVLRVCVPMHRARGL